MILKKWLQLHRDRDSRSSKLLKSKKKSMQKRLRLRWTYSNSGLECRVASFAYKATCTVCDLRRAFLTRQVSLRQPSIRLCIKKKSSLSQRTGHSHLNRAQLQSKTFKNQSL